MSALSQALVFVMSVGAGTGVAQVVDAQAHPAEAAPVPLRKDVDPLLRMKYTRLAEEAFRAAATPDNPEWDEPTRMLHWVQAGDWKAVGGVLKQFDAESARRIHVKICSDLMYSNPRSVLLPEDALGLADASPIELEGYHLEHVAGVLRAAMQETESRTELMKLLQHGTARLGGKDPERRRITARVLAGAQLLEEAKVFGMTEADPKTAASPGQTAAPEQSGRELVTALAAKLAVEEDRNRMLEDIHVRLLQSTPQAIDKLLREVVADNPNSEPARLIFGMIGQTTAAAGREVDLAARALHTEIQWEAMQVLASTVGFQNEPWRTLAGLTANNWLTEARNSFKQFPTWQRLTGEQAERFAHVRIEHLIRTAPGEKWLEALPPQLGAFVEILLTRLILMSGNIDRAVPHLGSLQRNDTPAAAALANEYLETWSRQHDPNLSPELLRTYQLDKQVVVVTRAAQEASLAQLAALLVSLEPATRALLDDARLARAFDYCHSRAEIYTREHAVTVFGPLEQIPTNLAVLLVQQMRDKLALQWRELSVQRDAATRRTAADIFALVNQGYAEATAFAENWLTARADAWRMESAAGSLFADWSEFAYFQSVAAEESDDRFSAYLEHSRQALEHFRKGAKEYAAQVPVLGRENYDLLPYRAWFYGLLGITHDGGINLRKGVTREGLNELRQSMLDLPGGASEVHLQLFSTMVADNVKTNRIAPEMKYRYLSGAVQVTGSRATIYPAEEKIKYYDSLLKEIRLQTRVDGSERIHTPGEFGLFVSLLHTTDVARESGGFDRYLMNQVQKNVSGRTVVEKPLYRDRFEEALRVTLGNFFDIRTIVFANPADATRDIPAPAGAAEGAWQETPLCYVLLATKDATVDRVPALEIDIDFFDREGKVVIPVPSNPLQIELTADAPSARPVTNIAVSQIVDSRELANDLLKIDVSVTADGLVPELDQILRLKGYALPILEVADEGGLQVKQLHNGPEGLYPHSERNWTIHLDPTPLLRGAGKQIEFQFPAAMSPDTTLVYRRYEDLDPVEAAAKFTLVEGDAAENLAQVDYRLWAIGGAAILLAVACLILVLVRNRRPDAIEGPPLFTLPADFTPFSVSALLHRIQNSPAFAQTAEQRLTLQADTYLLERQVFARQGSVANKQELERTARRWLDNARSLTNPVRST